MKQTLSSVSFLLSLAHAWDLQPALQKILAEKADFYNCTMVMGYHDNDTAYSLASGQSDRESGRDTKITDRFVWGSVTKVMTGSSVLRICETGQIACDGPMHHLIDPFFAKTMPKLVSLENLFGPEVNTVTVNDLLGMRSGIPDFDTALPFPPPPVDPLRATIYANPAHIFSPEELLSQPWVATGKLNFTPGTCDRKHYGNCYSSTNFVLLGLILAQHSGAESWEKFEQISAMPEYVQKELKNTAFAVSSPPSSFTAVHGYDTTDYNN